MKTRMTIIVFSITSASSNSLPFSIPVMTSEKSIYGNTNKPVIMNESNKLIYNGKLTIQHNVVNPIITNLYKILFLIHFQKKKNILILFFPISSAHTPFFRNFLGIRLVTPFIITILVPYINVTTFCIPMCATWPL